MLFIQIKKLTTGVTICVRWADFLDIELPIRMRKLRTWATKYVSRTDYLDIEYRSYNLMKKYLETLGFSKRLNIS